MAYSLGVGLLQEGAPELVLVRGVHEDELVIVGGQSVIHNHLDPITLKHRQVSTLSTQNRGPTKDHPAAQTSVNMSTQNRH